MRASDIEDPVVHFSVSGFQISVASTAADSLSADAVPPIARTCPSARMIMFMRRRAFAIGSISRHAGVAAFISITAARAIAGSPPPARRIFPGRYMASDSEYPLVAHKPVGPGVQLPVPDGSR